jgi:hypothetical protein
MNKIYVVLEGKIEDNLYLKGKNFKIKESYYDLRKEIGNTIDIVTYDCTLFCFSTLEKSVNDVILLKKDKYISLSELLENKYNYTEKEIRKAHNVLKMFRGEAFNWRSLRMQNVIKEF